MHKILAATAVASLTLAGAAPQLRAQDSAAPKCHVICAPVFVAQPGVVVSDVINKPAIDPSGATGSASTHFLARFTTVIPTQIPRTAVVALVQWTPFNRNGPVNPTTGKQFNSNAPAFVYGPVFDLFDPGPLNFSIDALGVYAPGGTSSSYHHIFVMEGIAGLSVGHMMQMMGGQPSPYLKGVAINALYSQQLSDRVPDATGSKKLTPNLLFLLTLPFSPLP